MNRISCFIIDDQKYSVDSISKLITKVPGLELLGFETKPITALNKILNGMLNPGILFLDIDMPELDGIQFSEIIGTKAVIIFITAHPDYAVKAFDVGAVDYLIKPIELSSLIRATERAKEKLSAQAKTPSNQLTSHYIFLKLTPRNIIKLKVDDIIFIKADDKYIDIHLKSGKPIQLKKQLHEMEQILPAEHFMRVHKSHIVNMAFVNSIVGNKMIMEGAPVLDIGPSYLSSVYARYGSQ